MFTRSSTSWKYQIAQVYATLNISQLLAPLINDLTFNTKSYLTRTCSVGDQCEFYMFL